MSYERVSGLFSLPNLTEEQIEAMDKRGREREERELKRLEEESADDKRRQLQFWIERGLPAKDLPLVTGGGLANTRALEAAQDAMGAGLALLVLSGTRGCGKTTAASWWLVQDRPALEYVQRLPARFVDANRLSRWPRYDDDRMESLERASALVVDDLGVEYDDRQGNFRSLFDALVNARYALTLPTLITTNLPAEAFKERYGERVADRIREVGRFVSIAGESMRGTVL